MKVCSSSGSIPVAYAPPTRPPILVPAATSMGIRCSSSQRMTPTCAMPRALPPPNATPTVGRVASRTMRGGRSASGADVPRRRHFVEGCGASRARQCQESRHEPAESAGVPRPAASSAARYRPHVTRCHLRRFHLALLLIRDVRTIHLPLPTAAFAVASVPPLSEQAAGDADSEAGVVRRAP